MIEWLFDNVAYIIRYIVCNCSYSVSLFFTSKSITKSSRGNLYSWNVCTFTFITHVPSSCYKWLIKGRCATYGTDCTMLYVHTSWLAFVNGGRVRPSMLPSEINSRIENSLWGDAFSYDLYPFQARSFLVLGRAFYSRRLFEWGSFVAISVSKAWRPGRAGPGQNLKIRQK